MIDFREKCHGLALLPALLIMVCCALGAGQAKAAQEETYPLLQIGTITYTNVTVTTKAKKYIFVLHSTGMANIRVADLPPDIRKALGYTELEQKDKANVAKATAWAREALSRFSTPQVMAMEEQVQKGLRGGSSDDLSKLLSLNKGALFAILGLSLAIFLFFSYCCMLICKKTGNEPGGLVWLPLLQIFPMFKAAGMSPLWFLAWIIPVLNFLPAIILCFKLAKARGKSPFVGFLLLLPVTSLFAFLYLAFSSGAAVEKQQTRRPVRIMKFGTA